MNIETIIDEIMETDEYKTAMRCVIRQVVMESPRDDRREEAEASAELRVRLDEIMHKHAAATGLVEGDEVTIRAHGRFCTEVGGRYVVELDNGVLVKVQPDMLVRRRKGEL